MVKFTKTEDLQKTIEASKKKNTIKKGVGGEVQKTPEDIKREKELAFDRNTYNYHPFKDLKLKSNSK